MTHEISTELYNECNVLETFLSLEYYNIGYNRIIFDEDIDEIVSIYKDDNDINSSDREYIYTKTIDGEKYNYAIECREFVDLIEDNNIIGFGGQCMNAVFVQTNDNIQLWSLRSDDEESEAELLETFTKKSDFDSILKELKVIFNYDDKIFLPNYQTINVIIEFINNFISINEDERVSKLTEFESKCEEFGIDKDKFLILAQLHNKEIGF